MSSRGFPPGIGWIPLAIAAVIIGAVSTIAAVPQFHDSILGTASVPGQSGGGGVAANNGGGSQGSGTKTGSSGGHSTGGGSGSGGSHSGAGGGGTGGGGTGGGGTGGGGGGVANADCSKGQNAGATAPGVSATQINVATTDVTTGVGAPFLGEAVAGMQAAFNQINAAGGVCGRRIHLDAVNDGWNDQTGQTDISNFINDGQHFALVGEPDSEGLRAAIDSHTIDSAGMPVVGTDGMLADQYFDPWVWPVASSTVTNMHIAVKYAYDHGARSFGIVFDQKYKFGKEGAYAFDQEVRRLTGQDVQGYTDNTDGNGCVHRYCAINPDTNNYSSAINELDASCSPCDMVMMLLEPGPMEAWMNGEKSASTAWYKSLNGGEPLFDDNLGSNCDTCGGMVVWTGYRPDVQPFDGQQPVYTFTQALGSVCPNCDPHNEFTEGAYLGARLFIEACKQVGANLTRDALKQALDSMTFDSGIAQPLHWGTSSPRVANYSMAAFSDNSSGSFNGWNYQGTGFIQDPARGQDFQH